MLFDPGWTRPTDGALRRQPASHGPPAPVLERPSQSSLLSLCLERKRFLSDGSSDGLQGTSPTITRPSPNSLNSNSFDQTPLRRPRDGGDCSDGRCGICQADDGLAQDDPPGSVPCRSRSPAPPLSYQREWDPALSPAQHVTLWCDLHLDQTGRRPVLIQKVAERLRMCCGSRKRVARAGKSLCGWNCSGIYWPVWVRRASGRC